MPTQELIRRRALCDTIFTRTDQEFKDYIGQNYYPGAPPFDIEIIAKLYPSNPFQGSPFNTGDNNTLTSQYKRLAAFQGDVVCIVILSCVHGNLR